MADLGLEWDREEGMEGGRDRRMEAGKNGGRKGWIREIENGDLAADK